MDNGEVKSLAELATHFKYMRDEIDWIKRSMATKDDIATLHRKIDDNSPSALWSGVTKVALGIAAIAAAAGVFIAVLRAFKFMA